jgi:hypothetical protein
MRTQKIVQKIVLMITILGLLGGTVGTAVVSLPATSSLSSEKRQNEIARAIGTTGIDNEGSSPGGDTLQYTLHFSATDLSFDTLFGYDLVRMKDCSYLNEIGKPLLPTKNILIALPNGMRATNLQILSTREQPIQGTYTIFPAQRPLPIGETYDSTLLAPPNRATYTSALPYPSQLASLGPQTDLAGQGMVAVTIYPIQYLPLQKKLTLMTSITFRIAGTSGYICGDYLSEHISKNGRDMYQRMVQAMVINPESVELHTAPGPHPMGVGPGDYEYVIVTQDSWVSAFQPLANWETQKGVPATIVNTTWIYTSGGYNGTNVQKIRAFVQDVYTTWGTTYVLLGGDIDVVPCHYRTFSSVDPDPVPNDAYYADFDADWVCEVNVGRASVTGPGNSTGQIGNFIHKVFTYERNPPITNYAQNAGFFGFDLDSITHAEQCKVNINSTYIPTSWTVTTVYDSQTGNHRTKVINALNAGQNIVNHADHSNSDCMGTGYYHHHNWVIYSSDMDNLTNGNKQTILYSMGCDPAAYDVSDCIAEHFVQNSNGGGIAFIGNSRYGWYNYGQYNTLSMGYDVHFFESLFQENLFHLGAAFSDHKNDVMQSHPGDDYYEYCFTELTLLGDPELPVWTVNPAPFVVSHPLVLPLGSSPFTVHVQATNGSNLGNAYVCLWKGSEVYQRGFTNSTGNITFTVSPVTGGNMSITVTKQNYIPSESIAQVQGNLPPNQPSSPSPQNNATSVPLSSDLNWTGGDPNPGDTVTYDVHFATTTPPSKVMGNQSQTSYDPGILSNGTRYYWKIVAWDNHGASTTGPVWQFTTVYGKMVIKNVSSNWNFISLPFNQSVGKSNLRVKYNGVEYSWQEAVNHSVVCDFIFGWNRTYQNYELVDLFTPGEGYWMFAYHACELSAVGVGGFEPDTYITGLLQNWNLIGAPTTNSVVKQNLRIRYNGTIYTWQNAVTNSIILGFIYGWNETSQIYQLTDVLQPGESYWMYAYHNCTLL